VTILKIRDILKGLEKKGFHSEEGDHTHLILHFNGKKTIIRTKVSHGSNEIGDNLINLMSIQTKLDKKKFIDLVNCPLSMENYLQELRNQGVSLS
jgi:hypothetical protein